MLEDAGRRVEAEIAEMGGEALFVNLDVTSEDDWRDAVDAAKRRFGGLHILVNNAGVWNGGNVESETAESWDRVMDINGKGVFLGTKAAIPAMRESGGGSIVNISSVAGLIGSAGATAYNASKGAVRLLTKSTAVQYAAEGIRCNSVHPGPIVTQMLDEVYPSDEIRQQRQDAIPLGRLGKMEDVARGVLVPSVRRGVLHDGQRAGNRRRRDGDVGFGGGDAGGRVPAPSFLIRGRAAHDSRGHSRTLYRHSRESGNPNDCSQASHQKSSTNSSQRIPSPFMGEG